MRLKVISRGPHEIFFFELCVKNQFIWLNNSLFPLKSSLFLMFAGRMWPAGRVFETPDLEITMGGFHRASTGKNKKVIEISPLLAFWPERAKE